MSEADIARDLIIKSLFSKRAADGSFEETYVSHVCIHENVPTADGQIEVKERYLLLSVDRAGRGFVYKSKKNSNASFSIGKTWKLDDLRSIEIHSPTNFSMAFARKYRWESLRESEQRSFIAAVTEVFRRVTSGRPLSVRGGGQAEPNGLNGRPPSDRNGPARTGTPPAALIPSGLRPRPPAMADRIPSSSSQSSTAPTPIPPPNGLPVSLSRPTYLPSQPSALRSQNSSPAPGAPRPLPPAIAIPSVPSSVPTLVSSVSSIPRSASGSSIVQRTQSPGPRTSSRAASRPSVDESRGTRPSMEDSSSYRSVSRSRRPSEDEPQTARPPLPPNPSRPSFTSSRAPAPDETHLALPQPPQTQRTATPSRLAAPAAPARRDTTVARISAFDPTNQANLERLLSTDLSTAGGPLADEETVDVTIANVEEMLDGYEWNFPSDMRAGKKGAADQMEARLMDELLALEKANVHSFVESDDRIGLVMHFIDDAIKELDDMEGLVQSYKIQLNAVSDDISFIQSQNRGLQVQTQNQRALLDELDKLLQTVDVQREALITLTQDSLEQPKGICRLEEAAAQLYKALLAGQENEMAATMDRLEEYRTHNSQFCKRLLDFLTIMFQFQTDRLLNEKERAIDKAQPRLMSHEEMEQYLSRYSGLMLYLKEMDEERYGQVCASYFTTANGLHSKEMKTFLPALANLIRRGTDEENEINFSSTTPNATAPSAIRRAGTLARSPLERKKDKTTEGELKGYDAFARAINQIGLQVSREEDFIADFLQINDAGVTFADYMKLENYYRRQAARYAGLTPVTIKLTRDAMDLIFGFLPGELKLWTEAAMRRDNLQLVGMIFVIERTMQEIEGSGRRFFQGLLEKQHRRMYQMLDRLMEEQVKAIEQTKLTTKKRKGAAHFVRYLPTFVTRVENQLIGADGFEIRNKADSAYEKIVQAMFDCLQQMAKMDGGEGQAGEDKGQLNYHVIMIENMHLFVAEMSQLEIAVTRTFVGKAESIYDENLSGYLKLVLRRPLSKILNYFDGVEKLLQTSSATDVSNNSSFNKASLKRALKDFSAKDMRKIIEALYRRIEKHFAAASEGAAATGGEDSIAAGPVLAGVWKACEDELVRQTERFKTLIAQCYADSGVTLDFTTTDIHNAFKRN